MKGSVRNILLKYRKLTRFQFTRIYSVLDWLMTSIWKTHNCDNVYLMILHEYFYMIAKMKYKFVKKTLLFF